MYDTDFDRQKLMYHPAEVGAWLTEGRSRGPLYTEMELARRCNCRCIFCGVDYQVNKTNDEISADDARGVIDGLAALGNKAIMFCGHGEPLLNADAEEIISHAAARMSASMTTNGIALTPARLALIDGLEWIRFSINGGTPENYAAVHGTQPETFERVLENIAAAVARKRARKLDVTLGTQLVLLNENAAHVVELAEQMKDLGVDYFSVKPYSKHPLSEHDLEVACADTEELGRALRAMETETFRVIYRASAMARVGYEKPYRVCYGTEFMCFISANGDVWECNIYAGDPRFFIGNACRELLEDIWHGEQRRRVREYIQQEMDCRQCRDLCRMDACNAYLWRLQHPWPHDNFI
jgi:MoaA/NifB/PqqE/SkfB family radical SAM enzyme